MLRVGAGGTASCIRHYRWSTNDLTSIVPFDILFEIMAISPLNISCLNDPEAPGGGWM
jgi:hypothetical protein